jgi:hypothetical protein
MNIPFDTDFWANLPNLTKIKQDFFDSEPELIGKLEVAVANNAAEIARWPDPMRELTDLRRQAEVADTPGEVQGLRAQITDLQNFLQSGTLNQRQTARIRAIAATIEPARLLTKELHSKAKVFASGHEAKIKKADTAYFALFGCSKHEPTFLRSYTDTFSRAADNLIAAFARNDRLGILNLSFVGAWLNTSQSSPVAPSGRTPSHREMLNWSRMTRGEAPLELAPPSDGQTPLTAPLPPTQAMPLNPVATQSDDGPTEFVQESLTPDEPGLIEAVKTGASARQPNSIFQ